MKSTAAGRATAAFGALPRNGEGMSGELKVFGGRAHPELTEKICAFLNLAPGKVTLYNFSDGETFFQIRENVRGSGGGWSQSWGVAKW